MCGIVVHIATMTKSGRAKAGVRIPKKTKVVVVQQPKAKKKKSVQPIIKELFPKGSFSKAGAMLGGFFGPAGARVGSLAGTALSRITGVGDYKVKSNSIMTETASFSGEVPQFGKTDNSTRVRHREFVADITVGASPGNFVNTSYVINPSNSSLFPWLARFAENYQQYRLHGMVFMFKSTTSDYSAAGALGKVALATNYNVRDADYANMQELENAEFSVSGKPSLSRVHPIECAASNGVPLVKWVRDTNYDASGGDDRLYDVGKFQFATQGLPVATANATIGELWVSYDIEFFKPIVGRNPTGTQYEPVVVPQFNSLAGNNTRSLFMVERTQLTAGSLAGKTRAELWNLVHSPDAYERVSQLNIDSALVTRSLVRPTPDPDPSYYTYPGYWSSPPGIGNKVELRITRPGIWYMHFAVGIKQVPTSVQYTSGLTECEVAGPHTQICSGFSQWQQDAIQIDARNADSSLNEQGNIQVLSYGVSTGNPLNSQSNRYTSNPLGGQAYSAYIYRNGLNWTLIMWVPQVLVSEDKYVAVRFQTANETATTIGPAFQSNLVDQFDITKLESLSFEVGVVSVSEQTYYRPVEQGLTKDDRETLEQSVNSVAALLPKLRELGFNID